MKKKRSKIIITSILGVILISLGIVIFLTVLNDENKLSSAQRNWINQNINNVQNVYVIKNSNVFSEDGKGVFYDFLDDFTETYGIKTNQITFNQGEEINNIKLNVVKKVEEKDKLIYTDNYVVVSNTTKKFALLKDLNNIKVGILSSDLEYVKSYLKEVNIEYVGIEKEEELYEKLGKEYEYIIVPKLESLSNILKNNLTISYHLSDVNNYYVMNTTDSTFSSILSKYLNIWMNEKYLKSLNKNEFYIFQKSLGISDTEIDKLLSVDYEYAFKNNSPYEVIMSGEYGGIVAKYLSEFSNLTGVKFNITKYKNENNIMDALNRGKVDVYFDYNTKIDSNYLLTTNGINATLSVVTKKDNSKSFTSVYGLQNETVYVLEDSVLHKYLNTIGNIKIKTYKDIKVVSKLKDEDIIIVMDSYIFNYYKESKLKDYTSKYDTTINNTYNFRVNNDYELLYKLFNKYISILDSNLTINSGLNLHESIIDKGIFLNNIAKYTMIIIILVLAFGFILFKRSKRVIISKKVKKDEKIRFIDQLTSLKNRVFMTDFIKSWNNNTIYPQTIIVVDLNHLQEINDKYGYDEGDKQIQACANTLIRTQLDSSEIMRSDGNEFVIYLVGYTQKQVTNYIHKLNREFKKLPYQYGAEFGYSTITNNLKTIEDALNEAIEDMKKQKESVKNGK